MKTKIDREEVGRLLAEALECPSEDTFYLFAPVMAELCRAWLALDAAPEDTHYALDVDEREFVGTEEQANAVVGQRVRLVATPASGGQRDG